MKGVRDSSIVSVGGKAVVLEEIINSLMIKSTALNNPAKENVNSCATDAILFSFTLPDSLIEKRVNKIRAKSLA